ncbi:unnamed protein product [Zymoseptoria tritici ST99CH_1A5]|uniref:DUF1772 domain-containing protein n=2 Tax=Zymoseptoria tritici TaxID=1047171 RepID=A0A2H1GB48_ZYMTR|nr:unnamed protein product [Zymoseptoria tritici ST99CH_1E4]SMR51726.1 unnamed protein product [Zymoseptoria tritici ST99CH_3D1]SMY23490.1 unnamed protein product [Zymoseptoria tritici ST99CH_1A5]
MAQFGAFYTDNLGTPLRVAQVLGLTSTAFFAGKAFHASFATTPALLEAPAPLLARQWKKQFDADKWLAPAVAIFSSGVFSYIAYRDHAWTKTSILYATSSGLLLSLIPYSIFLFEPVNQKLEAKAQSLAKASLTDASAEAGVAKEETTHGLVDQWATINLGRAVIAGISAVTAVWAAVDRTDVVPATLKFGSGANRM